MTINGNGATVQRTTASGTPDFVLLAVSGRTAAGPPACYSPILTVNQTVLTRGSQGGLHLNAAGAVVQGSTITQNTGGGINNACGALTLLNSTVSYNTSENAYGGGGIFLWQFSCDPGAPSANISFSTIFENSNPGWGRGNAIGTNHGLPASVVLKNTILASPSHPSDAVCNNGAENNMLFSLGHNILGDNADVFGSRCSTALVSAGDMVNTNPLLGPSTDNGGLTPTDLPLANSPAIDAVPLADCTDVLNAPVSADQRNVARPRGPQCDVGAVEVGSLYRVCLLYDPTKAVRSGSTMPVKLQLCDDAGHDLSSASITAHAVSTTQSSNTSSGNVQDSGNANPDSDFRYDVSLGPTGGYIFNLSTKGLTTGVYNLNFRVNGDTFIYSAPFQVR